MFTTNFMIQKRSVWITASLVLCFLLFTVTACKMVAAPISIPVNQTNMPSSYAEEVKQQSLTWNLKTLVESYKNAGHTNAKWNDFAKLALTEFARARAKV